MPTETAMQRECVRLSVELLNERRARFPGLLGPIPTPAEPSAATLLREALGLVADLNERLLEVQRLSAPTNADADVFANTCAAVGNLIDAARALRAAAREAEALEARSPAEGMAASARAAGGLR